VGSFKREKPTFPAGRPCVAARVHEELKEQRNEAMAGHLT